jgi:hypothetical protein
LLGLAARGIIARQLWQPAATRWGRRSYAKGVAVIDVWGLLANSLWILGLALLLAVLSWSHWIASTEATRLRLVLDRPRVQMALYIGLALFSAGLAGTAQPWWERVLWLVLTVWWLISARLAWRRRGAHPIGKTE